jgi:hypothetical protein
MILCTLKLLSVALNFLSEKLAILLHNWSNHELNKHLLTRGRRRRLYNLFLRGLVIVFAPKETLEHIGVHTELFSNFRRKRL